MTITTNLMSKRSPFVSVSPMTRIEDVIELMRSNDAGAVVVVGEQGAPEGLITAREVLKAIDTRSAVLQALVASDVMSCPVLPCSLGESEEALMKKMSEGGVQYMPVVADGEAIDVISMEDLVHTRVLKIKSLMKEITDAISLESQLDHFTRYLKPYRAARSSPRA